MNYDMAYERARAKKRPFYYDGDLICNKCGEPWDAVGVWDSDMTRAEREKFFQGKGCPICRKKRLRNRQILKKGDTP